MIERSSAQTFIGVMSLLAVGTPMLASQGSQATTAEQNIGLLNVASLNSIESTWLKVPMTCKARGFNASPVALESKSLAPHIQNIYASFGV